MAGRIQLLPDEVVGKIAAGEVVERPAAAIKEMVENSLDAGATAVTVEIRDGGISYFRVTDNGVGIQQSEIRMAFERHATSKITRTDDLFAIRTLGFRGEALASIAAVAEVACTTRTRADATGVKVINRGGRIESIQETACPEGTTFVVRDLFFNTPVRLKFLKKPVTEAGYVSDLMMRLILSRPDVSFRYISQGKTLYHSAGDGKLASAVFSIYGRELLRSMREVDGHQAGVLMKGYVGVGESARASRGHQSFFINGRYMRSGVLSQAVEAACRERVVSGRYPTCVLHLTMPFETVDVNVHPNKLEVRFQNEAAVAEAVEAIVRDALQEKNVLESAEVMHIAPQQIAQPPVSVAKRETVQATVSSKETPMAVTAAVPTPQRILPEKKPVKETAAPIPKPAEPVKAVPMRPMSVIRPTGNSMKQTMAFPAEMPRPVSPVMPIFPAMKPVSPANAEQPKPVPKTDMPAAKASIPEQAPVQPSFLPDVPKPLQLMGTAFGSYIVAEYGDSLLLIDQRGVHERLLFDQMMKALGTEQCSQELLVPMIVSVTRREQQLLEEHRALLQSLGLTVEAFGETEAAIRAIPMILGQPQAGDLLREILDQLEGERSVISMEKRRSAILALACQKAVKPGQRLTESDLRSLVSRMVDEHITPTSPRGTPLIVALTRTDVDRRFRRLQ